VSDALNELHLLRATPLLPQVHDSSHSAAAAPPALHHDRCLLPAGRQHGVLACLLARHSALLRQHCRAAPPSALDHAHRAVEHELAHQRLLRERHRQIAHLKG